MATDRTFRSERSREHMYSIQNALKQHDRATIAEIATLTGMTPTNVGAYLKHMASVGHAYLAERPTMTQNRGVPGKWSLGPNPMGVKVEVDKDEVDNAPRRVIVRKEWDSSAVRRDPLVEAIFGKAA